MLCPAAEGKEFTSFKEVVRAAESGVPLISMNSTSKGFFGECGHRGGYFEASPRPSRPYSLERHLGLRTKALSVMKP